MTTGAGLGRSTEDPRFAIHPATPERWADLERLFGARGACGGCWCMYWLLPGAAFDLQKGEPNRLALMARVGGGEAPGLIGYQDDAPVAWCAVGPRARYPRLNRSRILAPVDDAPVWSLVCLFVARRFRRAGWSAPWSTCGAPGAPSWRPTRWSPAGLPCPTSSPGPALCPLTGRQASWKSRGARPRGRSCAIASHRKARDRGGPRGHALPDGPAAPRRRGPRCS
jgi:hypothetical protein